MNTNEIAVLIPCYNEELTIEKVIDDFRRALPEATLYVYDNNSTDATAALALDKGVVLRKETRQGKGNVIRQMFRDIDADFYLLVDGDDTYPAEHARELLAPLEAGDADMVIGDRLSNGTYHVQNKKLFHSFGNRLVRSLIKLLYRVRVVDVLTGYRAMSRLYVKNCPLLSKGFEVETELTIHTIDKNWRYAEVPIDYRERPEGSFSKISTIKDGSKVLLTILSLFKDYKPLALFSLVGVLLLLIGCVLGGTVIVDFINTGLVERFPTAILAVGFVITGMLALSCGFILDTSVKEGRKKYELQVLSSCAALDKKEQV